MADAIGRRGVATLPGARIKVRPVPTGHPVTVTSHKIAAVERRKARVPARARRAPSQEVPPGYLAPFRRSASLRGGKPRAGREPGENDKEIWRSAHSSRGAGDACLHGSGDDGADASPHAESRGSRSDPGAGAIDGSTLVRIPLIPIFSRACREKVCTAQRRDSFDRSRVRSNPPAARWPSPASAHFSISALMNLRRYSGLRRSGAAGDQADGVEPLAQRRIVERLAHRRVELRHHRRRRALRQQDRVPGRDVEVLQALLVGGGAGPAAAACARAPASRSP